MRNLISCILLIVCLSGCGTTAKFVYPDNVQRLVILSERPIYNKKVAVTPFEEQRGSSNVSGSYWLYLIPVMPFGFGTYERPDAARMFNSVSEFHFDVVEDLAKASVTSIRKSGLFEDVFFTYGGEKDKADFIFSGKVISTKYEGAIYSYGLSVYGPLLWWVGLPSGSSENHLAVQFNLIDRLTNATVWQYSHTSQNKIIQGLYYNYGHDVKGYASLMEDAMNGALLDMRKSLDQYLKQPK